MVPFHAVFPEVAKAETRFVILEDAGVPSSSDIPADSYALVEYYCDDKGCDCRRVLLRVIARSADQEVARISHAFDPPAKSGAGLPQTFVDPLGPRTPCAQEFLALFKERVLDETYAQRLERHYAMVKEAVARRGHGAGEEYAYGGAVRLEPITGPTSTGPNQPCPCGSGRKYKKCCGRLG